MFGIDDLVGAGLKIIDRIIPDKKAADEAKLKLFELQQQGELKLEEFNLQLAQGQIDTNKIEAESENIFKSGWRPFIGWVCGFAFVYDFLFRPLFNGILTKHGYPLLSLDSPTLTSLTFGLLGLGAFRSFDKTKRC